MREPLAIAVSGVGGGVGCPELVDSSEPWDEPFSSTAAQAAFCSRLRFMCSYGGRIVPRSTDKSLYYAGGENRMVVVDRQSSLAELTAKISSTYFSGRPFILKYQLPNEDLDALISVTTDEDLENMIEEYDRISATSPAGAGAGSLSSIATARGSGGSSRNNHLRLFLFPAKAESAPASTIGTLLDYSKSETWFEDAFNTAMGGMGMDAIPRGHSADAASVNSLLGLDDDSCVHARGGATVAGGDLSRPEQLVLPRPDSSGKLARQGQDVHSVPDSPMLDNTSSFGSTSSAPSLSSLPPIRPDELSPDQRMAGLDDHFAQMNLSSIAVVAAAAAGQGLEESYKQPVYATQHQPPPSISLPNSSATQMISPNGNHGRALPSDEDDSNQGSVRKPQPPKSSQTDATMPDSVSRTTSANVNTDLRRPFPASSDPTLRVLMPVSDSAGYLWQPEQQQQQQQQQQQPQQPALPHLLNQQQQQFVPASTHYIHHPATGTVVPIPSYYQIVSHPIQQSQQAHPYNQQFPIYYVPVSQTPYDLAALQPSLGNFNAVPTAGKSELPVPQVPPKPELPTSLYSTVAAASSPAGFQPSLIHVAADQAHSYAGMGYRFVPQHHLSQSPATIPNYAYEYAADPAQTQMYYSQATLPLASAPQYQTVSSATVNVDTMAPGDVKAMRAS